MATAAAQLQGLRGSRARSPGFWGMMLLIATEASLFAYLLFSYFYLGSMAAGPWPPDGPPSLKLVIPNTILLLLSSATMYWAESGIREGNKGRLRMGLLATLVLGMVFLAIQGVEYSKKHFTPTTSAYGSLFFTITGFHGAHVFVGLLMIAVILARAYLGHFRAGRHEAVTNVSWYWHFVDVVWLCVFTSLYISPYLG
ncbi:MAG: cytochrome c oxidase subunit 3 [Gemmatimonadales bacterium]